MPRAGVGAPATHEKNISAPVAGGSRVLPALEAAGTGLAGSFLWVLVSVADRDLVFQDFELVSSGLRRLNHLCPQRGSRVLPALEAAGTGLAGLFLWVLVSFADRDLVFQDFELGSSGLSPAGVLPPARARGSSLPRSRHAVRPIASFGTTVTRWI